MCGLVAIISKKDNPINNEENLKLMSREIEHRGPDDEGYYFGDWFSLGFQRLSILPRQKNSWVVFGTGNAPRA